MQTSIKLLLIIFVIANLPIKTNSLSHSNSSICCGNDRGISKNNVPLLESRRKFISDNTTISPREVQDLIQQTDSIYKDIIDDLHLCSQLSNKINCKKIIETTLACAKIDRLVDEIAGIKSEIERIKFITGQCGINAEPDFCPGDDFLSVKTTLDYRTNALRSAYKFSRETKELDRFFLKAFQGDPCLNGRIIALTNFQVEHDLGISSAQIKDTYTYDEFAFKCTELMYGVSDENPPNQREFTEYLKSQKDYTSTYKKWVESNQWTAIYKRAIELFT